MANPDHQNDGAPPRNVHIGPASKKKWLPWLLLALALLALMLGLRSCRDRDEIPVVATAPVAPVPDTAPVVPAPVPAPAAETAAVLPGLSSVGGYLAGTEALPRTFVFEKLNFDTAKSEIRAADREELNTLAGVMKQYPNSRIRIVGYADARGTAPANATLGKDRAESVKAALVAQGIAAERLETASGGETDPVDTNATASGQFENRRAELVVLQR
ncbi:OmpA family protein [Massilia sp. LjRoot122]|uniref:OmpA family protein n=1 Tax=Massilia sp. LjRoot122 TaxID=3342257 RepID=UPI003ECCC647